MPKIVDFYTVKELSELWDGFDWKYAVDELFRLQKELSAAAMCSDRKRTANIQTVIVNSLEARMLAVRHVSSAGGVSGEDGVLWKESHQKMRAALDLGNSVSRYQARPTRLFLIKPKRGKERYAKISTVFDRAMQVLYSYTVTPVAEVTGDKLSFGYRKNRSGLDAHVYIMRVFGPEDAPGYVVKADVKACYENISHKWLLKNIPMNKEVLKQFLSAGFVFEGGLFPADDYGLSISSSISPVLANMVLDGLQAFIYKCLNANGGIVDYSNGYMIRFADDILVAVRTKESAERILKIISGFLCVRGLILSPAKTKIISIKNGFDFLARHYEKVDGMLFARPSDSAVARFENDLTEFIRGYKGSQQRLIEELNLKLSGWAGHHKFSDAADAFRRIDMVVNTLLLELCISKHSRMKKENIIKRYFYPDSDGTFVYALADKKSIRVKRLSGTPIVSHIPLPVWYNPFLYKGYYKTLSAERSIQNVTGKYSAVWQRQDGRCYFCGEPILADQVKEIAAKDPGRACAGINMAYTHERCARAHTQVFHTTEYFASSSDVLRRIEKIAADDEDTHIGLEFEKLKMYLWQQTHQKVMLRFKKIEEMLDITLPPNSESVEWWRDKLANAVSEAGQDSGYIVQRIDFKKKVVVFQRDDHAARPIKIPDKFLLNRIPANAVTELMNFFEYISDKYGL